MSTKYGNILDPYRQLREGRGVKGVRRTIRNTHNSSTIDPGGILYVTFPDLGKDDLIVPGTSKLLFKVNLNSAAGGNQDLNRTIVNNLGRAIVSKIEVKLASESIFTLNDADIFLCYQDLWKTTKERENAIYQGIQSEAIRKVRIDAGDKGTDVKDVAGGKAFKNKFYIPLDFEMLSSHNPFFQFELKDQLSYELTFNNYEKVVVSTDTNASYTISDIILEFDVVTEPDLAMLIKNQYAGRSVVMYDQVLKNIKKTLNKSDTVWNFSLTPKAKSLKGILILFIDPADGGANYARDSEKFYNPKIKKVSVTINGNPNQLYSSGMLPEHNFAEARKFFAGGKHRTAPHTFKEGEDSDVTLLDYLTTKYSLWLDMRTTEDDLLHGSGRKIEGDSQSIQIEIEKEVEAAGNLNAYVYYIKDAQLNIENGRKESIKH